MIEPLSLLTAFLLGLFGSSHCLVMCGGIAAAIGAKAGERRVTAAILFNSGRILSYTLAGTLVATLGLWLQQQNTVLMTGLRTLAAVMLILMGLYIARWSMLLTRFEQLGNILWKYIQPLTTKALRSSRMRDQLLLGMLWGWLPCGLIYSTLSWVAANGQPVMGALAMLTFGLGTLPALFATTLAGSLLTRMLGNPRLRQLAGLIMVGYGVWTGWVVWFHS